MASDIYIKRAIARFKRDVSDGYYEKAWQDKAKRSHAERQQGKFDDYLRQCADEMFAPEEENDEFGDDGYESDEDFKPGVANGSKRQRTVGTSK